MPVGAPDFEKLQTPNFTMATFTELGGGGSLDIVSSAVPFRVWSAWLSVTVSTASTYAAGGVLKSGIIVTSAAFRLINFAWQVNAPNQLVHKDQFIDLKGIVVGSGGAPFKATAQIDANAANSFAYLDGGIVYSIP